MGLFDPDPPAPQPPPKPAPKPPVELARTASGCKVLLFVPKGKQS